MQIFPTDTGRMSMFLRAGVLFLVLSASGLPAWGATNDPSNDKATDSPTPVVERLAKPPSADGGARSSPPAPAAETRACPTAPAGQGDDAKGTTSCVEPDKARGSWIMRFVTEAQIVGAALMGNPIDTAKLMELWLEWAPAADWIVGIGLTLLLLPVFLSILRFLIRRLDPVFNTLFRLWLRPQPNDAQKSLPVLLKDQHAAIDRFISEARELGPGLPGRMAGLHGAWGTGKSFVVRALLAEAQKPENEKILAVHVNIWEEQREQDLHLALVRAVLGHNRLFQAMVGRYPRRLLFAPLLGVLSRLLPKGLEVALGGSQASLKAGVSIAMLWQQSFRQVVEGAVRNGWRFIVILDEIDRADPPLAQAAITLARRALDLPGVLVVMPYVEEQIRYKVFNPLNAVSPDLLGTQEAILEDTELTPAEAAQWETVVNAMLASGTGSGKDDPPTVERLRERRRLFLSSIYLRRSGDRGERERLFIRMSEKYLAWRVVLKGAQGVGLVDFVLRCHTVFRKTWTKIVGRGDQNEKAAMEVALEKLADDGLDFNVNLLRLPPGFAIRSLRSFEGLLDEMLDEAKNDLSRLAEEDPRAVEARVVAILVLACIVTRMEMNHGGR